MPDDGLQLIDVVEFETSQPDVTYEYVHKAYVGYQLRVSVPLGNYRFRARSCVGGPFRYDITDHVIHGAEVRDATSHGTPVRRAHRARHYDGSGRSAGATVHCACRQCGEKIAPMACPIERPAAGDGDGDSNSRSQPLATAMVWAPGAAGGADELPDRLWSRR